MLTGSEGVGGGGLEFTLQGRRGDVYVVAQTRNRVFDVMCVPVLASEHLGWNLWGEAQNE
jgi:hypothetical protein